MQAQLIANLIGANAVIIDRVYCTLAFKDGLTNQKVYEINMYFQIHATKT